MRKLLIGSVVLNVALVASIAWGLLALADFGRNFTRVPAERWRTQFDILHPPAGGVVFLGDSITEGGHWSELFGSAAMLNRGIGGDTTGDVLARLGQVYALEPAKLFLMIGVNDLNSSVDPAVTRANLRLILDGLAARLPGTQVFVQSVLPVNADWRWGADNTGIDALNAFLREECTRRGLAWVDLRADFADAGGALRADLSNDGIHLLGAGYALWRDRLLPLVQQ
jgi:lysophospholipase L1-like esterase